MDYPQVINFKFDVSDTFVIPSNLVGKPGLIAYEIYGTVDYYKPLCHANNIIIAQGVRLGIRSEEDAYRRDLKSEGYTQREIDDKIEIYRNETIYSDNDWINVGNTLSGYVTDLYESRTLIVPSTETCRRWLGLYGDRNNK